MPLVTSDSGIYEVLHRVVPPLAKAIWRPTVVGLEHVPRTGGVILASNHLSFADSVVIPVVVPRKVVFLAKSDYFTGRGVKGTASRLWFEGLGMLPVDRDDTKAALASLDTALEVLGPRRGVRHLPRGHPLARRPALPRPHRCRPPRAHRRRPRRPGRAHRHREAPAGRLLPAARRPVTVRFGAPVEVAGRFDGVPTGRARREVTDEIMAAIAHLSGQEPAGVYNERPADT